VTSLSDIIIRVIVFLVIGRSGETIVKFVFCGLWVAVRLYGGRNFSRLGKIIRFSVQRLGGDRYFFPLHYFLSPLVSRDCIDFDF